MNKIDFRNLNKIPVRTKEWLKVNCITLNNYELLNAKDFNGTNIIGVFDKVKIKKIDKNDLKYKEIKFQYGVGEDLIKQGENDFNVGILIQISSDTEVQEPIVIEFKIDKENNFLADYLIIEAEENSKANIIIKYNSLDDSPAYHNGICKVIAKNNSSIQLVKVNMLNHRAIHLDSNVSVIQENGSVDFVSVDLGGQYSITNYHGDLIGKGGVSKINSFYLGDKERKIDINYIVSHKGEGTKSEMFSKGALKDFSKKTFRGTLEFKKGASKSKGLEDEYCMILSKTSKSIAIPLLLCDEDDVSGEHSASSGKIDENKLFYLMSRGLSYDEARVLIVQAAFNPIIDMVSSEELKAEILDEVNRRIVNE